MTDFTGTAGNDTLVGTADDDLIQGLGGNDNLSGGAGNDRLEGGAGEDMLNGRCRQRRPRRRREATRSTTITAAMTSSRVGPAPTHRISRSVGAAATTTGWTAAPTTTSSESMTNPAPRPSISWRRRQRLFLDRGAAALTIDAGAGDDLIDSVVASVSLALGGGGADRIRINGQSLNAIGGSIAVTGFDAGDSFDIVEFLNVYLTNWDFRTNPFATGHFRLVQSGADALFQVDWNGGNNSYVTFITFAGTAASSLTAFNLGGWASDGSAAAGVNLVGDPWANDTLVGGTGNDFIQGLGGSDTIRGGAGDDRLEGGSEADSIYGGLGDDLLEGGAGNDTLFADLRGNDILRGGEGNDGLIYTRVGDEAGWTELDGGAGDDSLTVIGWQPSDDGPAVLTRIRLFGGDGADTLYIYRADEVVVDAGAGNDRIDLDTYTNARITLGSGSDVIKLDELRNFPLFGKTITITDFEAGPGGDRLDWSAFLASALPTWDRSGNRSSAICASSSPARTRSSRSRERATSTNSRL